MRPNLTIRPTARYLDALDLAVCERIRMAEESGDRTTARALGNWHLNPTFFARDPLATKHLFTRGLSREHKQRFEFLATQAIHQARLRAH